MGCMSCVGAKVAGAVKLAQAELGIGIAPPDVVADRRKACEACPEWEHGRCRMCGCFTWSKSALCSERCPKGVWNAC